VELCGGIRRDWMLLIVDGKTNHRYNFADHNNIALREREREREREKREAIMRASPTTSLTSPHLSL
jgi:hypothetical protein